MRAEELVAEIYRQKNELQTNGKYPKTVVMNSSSYNTIQDWHKTLGTLEGTIPDYISKETIFGLDILLDSAENPVVSD